MKNYKRLLAIIFIGVLCLSGCGKINPEGVWVEEKQVLSDGSLMKADDIPCTETFVISENKASDTIHFKDGSLKDITITYDMEKTGDNEYVLKAGSLELTTVTFEKNAMYFRIQEENGAYTDFYFKRQ